MPIDLIRRSLIATAVTLPAALPLASAALAAPEGDLTPMGPSLMGHVQRAGQFLWSLSSSQHRDATFGWTDPLRARWNYFGPGTKPGLTLDRMDAAQEARARDLLAGFLGAQGIAKFDRVRVLQEVLRDRGDGPGRSAGNFSFALLGTLAEGGLWMLWVEGPHVSLSFTLVADTRPPIGAATADNC